MGAHGWCNSSCSCCNCQWLLHINGNQPNNHPLCLLLQRMLASCSSSKLTILRASMAKFASTRQTFQSPESLKHTFSHTKGSLQPDGLPHHIWRVLTLVSGTQHSSSSISTMLGPEWFIKPYIKAYNTPLNRNFHFQVR
jgi:hypothetical protein